MKKLSDFKGRDGIVVASKLTGIIMTILANKVNHDLKDEKNPLKLFTAFTENNPDEMMEIFAILSEKDPKNYNPDGAEAMTNLLTLAADPLIVGLFISQGQKGDATSSASHSENTEA